MNQERTIDYGWGPELIIKGDPAKAEKARAKRRTMNKISSKSRATNRRSDK